jgi:hypothetical protein
LHKALEIKHKYPSLEIYQSKKNCGVYQMFNALTELVDDNEWIQYFGADDRMFPDMLEMMVKNDTHSISRHVGVLFIKAQDIKNVGGYRNWRCAADADMIYRLRLKFKYHEKIMPLLFHRRQHAKQLTATKATGNGSQLREKYKKITADNYKAEKPEIYLNKTVKCKIEKL